MAKKIYKDSDILAAVASHLDEDTVVYGANGHYSIGAYHDLTKVSSVLGDKDYNSQANLDTASGVTTVEEWKNNNGTLPEYFEKAVWMKEF